MKKFEDIHFNGCYIAQLPECFLHETNRKRNILALMLGQKSQPTFNAGFSTGVSIYPHTLC